MYKISLFFSLLLFASIAWGQGVQVKVYQNTDAYSSTYRGTFVTEEEDHLNFSRISLAVSFSGKHNLRHELELFIPEFSTPIHDVKFPMTYDVIESQNFETTADSYSIRYEATKQFGSSNRIFFSLGAAINPYLVAIDYKPLVTWAYDTHVKTWGFSTNLVPRINFKLSERFLIDLNIPFRIYDLRIVDSRYTNPAIPIEQQETRETENIFFEKVYTIRLGLVYSFR